MIIYGTITMATTSKNQINDSHIDMVDSCSEQSQLILAMIRVVNTTIMTTLTTVTYVISIMIP